MTSLTVSFLRWSFSQSHWTSTVFSQFLRVNTHRIPSNTRNWGGGGCHSMILAGSRFRTDKARISSQDTISFKLPQDAMTAIGIAGWGGQQSHGDQKVIHCNTPRENPHPQQKAKSSCAILLQTSIALNIQRGRKGPGLLVGHSVEQNAGPLV